MVRARVRRRMDAWLIAATAVLLVGAGGPSLLLSELDVHVILGVGLALTTSGHLWLHRSRALAWLPNRRRAERASTPGARLVRAQDAVRELAFGVTVVTGVVLLAGGAGETAHLVAGFGLVGLAGVHAGLHRDWFARRLRSGPTVRTRAGARP